VISAVHEAFVSALGTGLAISAAVTLCAAALAWILIEPRPKATEPTQAEPGEQRSSDETAPELTAV
jgi:hypothetical protein